MYRRYRKRSSQSSFGLQIFFILIALATLGIFAVPSFLGTTDWLIPAAVILGLIIIIISSTILWILYKKERAKVRALQIADIDRMTGVEFEQYVGEILKFRGFQIEFTPKSGDYGIDIVARKNGERYGIQIKRYTDHVGNHAIAEVIGGMRYYNCSKSLVITNSYFTKNAKNLAEVNNCVLINRDELSKWIVEFQNQKKQNL